MSAPTVESLDALTDAAVVERLLAIEALRRELAVEEAGLIEQVQRRSLAFTHGCKNEVEFLRAVLQIGARDAAGRVQLSRAVSPRRSLAGEVLAPLHPQTAEAFAAGAVSARAASIVTETVDRLPACVLDEAHPAVEAVLLDFAAEHDPETLARHAKAVSARLDQDGAYRDLERSIRRRDVTLRRRSDGSGTLSAELTCECAEYLETILDTLAKPAPAQDGADGGVRDLRTPGQRRHDGLLTGLKLLFTAGALGKSGGCATTLVLSMDVDAFATGAGVALTGHGYAIPAEVAKRWLDPEARAILVLLSKTRGIEAYSSIQRLFTEQQRLAMFARDHGCAYPGCDASLAWTDAHHVTDYQLTRRTSVDDGALVCGTHHNTFERMGWRSTMIDGRPHWIPPTSTDPRQRPCRNTLHDY